MDSPDLVDVCVAANEQQAHIILGQLLEAGIECSIAGNAVKGTVGSIPFGMPAAQKIVTTPDFAERAREFIRERESSGNQADWNCPDCGELNDAGFEVCWNCCK